MFKPYLITKRQSQELPDLKMKTVPSYEEKGLEYDMQNKGNLTSACIIEEKIKGQNFTESPWNALNKGIKTQNRVK